MAWVWVLPLSISICLTCHALNYTLTHWYGIFYQGMTPIKPNFCQDYCYEYTLTMKYTSKESGVNAHRSIRPSYVSLEPVNSVLKLQSSSYAGSNAKATMAPIRFWSKHGPCMIQN